MTTKINEITPKVFPHTYHSIVYQWNLRCIAYQLYSFTYDTKRVPTLHNNMAT